MTDVSHNTGDARLRSIVDRIVRLEDEKAGLAADIKEVYQEAKSAGFDIKALRLVVRDEREDEEARAERERVQAEADLMLAAIGPLGAAAVKPRSAFKAVEHAVRKLDAMADEDGSSVTLESGGKTIIAFGKKAREAARAAEAAATA